MIRITIRNGIGLLALVALSACASHGARDQRVHGAEQCRSTETLTCDRFAGENYNCSCERGSKISDILDSY